MIEMKKKENELDLNIEHDINISDQLIKRRIYYFSNILLKYLNICKYSLDVENLELNKLISHLENLRI